MTYTFKDTLQNVTITIAKQTEDEAWMDLADTYGSGYVLENIEYLGEDILD